jgi:FKBP-type peptidyl-prolyl cis-trans isomerase (trigger factor)
MDNSIHNIETKWFENENGKFPAIVMGLNIFDEANFSSFLDHVLDQFKNQRMCSPEETSSMLVTIAGNITAEEFVKHWNESAKKDVVLGIFMSKMVKADVLHISKGEVLDTAALLLQ